MVNVNSINNKASALLDELIAIRRFIHQNPELSFEEYNTSAYIKSILKKHHIPFTEGWVKTGIVASIGDPKADYCVAIRADIDALPIVEQNTCSYASKNVGIMHACGHDVHTTCALGAAILLKQLESELNGRVIIIFQPGEEKLPGGASLMLKEKALGQPLPKAILGLHVFPEMEVGGLGFKQGEYMASTDEIYFTIHGKGGHAAMRGQYNSPLLMASKVLLKLEQLFTEDETKKHTLKPTVLAFGRIEGLGATNVIPNSVTIQGTFRAMDENWRKKAHHIIATTVHEICAQEGGSAEVRIEHGYPALVNHIGLTGFCAELAQEVVGKSNVHELALRMTAEDFAYYSQVMPACFFRLGTANSEKGINSPVHTSTFDIDEQALLIGVRAFSLMAVELLNKKPSFE